MENNRISIKNTTWDKNVMCVVEKRRKGRRMYGVMYIAKTTNKVPVRREI